MLAWLVTPPERAVACDASPSEEPDPLGEGEQAQIDWPLRKLSTRDLDDPTIALLDALLAVGLPVIEVHISNIFAREAFRHHSYVSRAARGVICGLGPQGYRLALTSMAELLKSEVET